MSIIHSAIRPLLLLAFAQTIGSADLSAQNANPPPCNSRLQQAKSRTLKTGGAQFQPKSTTQQSFQLKRAPRIGQPYRINTPTPFNLRTPRLLPQPAPRQLPRMIPQPQPPAPRTRPVAPPTTNRVPPAVGSVNIRGIMYEDHSAGTSLAQGSVQGGAFFTINSSTMVYDGQIRVTMQDVNRGNGFGVTAFRLTNVRRSGNSLIVQAPNIPALRGRTYHIAVFVYGARNRTADAGRLTIQ